jgi:FkbM family methyltransferase
MGLDLLELAEGFSCYASVTGEVEARNVYKEIFEDGCYDNPKLSEAEPFIVNAGGHIGLFDLYMKQKYPLSRIVTFEPAPETFNALHRNLARHNISGVVTYPFGLGSKAGTEMLTYYPTAHAQSTFVPQEKEVMKEMITGYFNQEFTNEFFKDIQIPVGVNRLSHFLDYYHAEVERIDLLKIDVEGMELGVLGGVDDKHWAMVRNVVMEVSDAYGALGEIESLLRSKGFLVTSELQSGPDDLKMYLVMAHHEILS